MGKEGSDAADLPVAAVARNGGGRQRKAHAGVDNNRNRRPDNSSRHRIGQLRGGVGAVADDGRTKKRADGQWL